MPAQRRRFDTSLSSEQSAASERSGGGQASAYESDTPCSQPGQSTGSTPSTTAPCTHVRPGSPPLVSDNKTECTVHRRMAALQTANPSTVTVVATATTTWSTPAPPTVRSTAAPLALHCPQDPPPRRWPFALSTGMQRYDTRHNTPASQGEFALHDERVGNTPVPHRRRGARVSRTPPFTAERYLRGRTRSIERGPPYPRRGDRQNIQRRPRPAAISRI